MTNKVFIDSSVLIEPLQNRKNVILNQTFACYINAIVVSEYLYKYIGLQNLGSPRKVQTDKKISEALKPYLITKTLEEFLFLELTSSVVSIAPVLMSQYNLLPNDAIILATCKFYGIKYLASHYRDYDVPCKQKELLY